MRRLALAITLACALSAVARAGEIHSTGAVAPPPPPPPSTATLAGENQTTDAPEESDTVLTIILAIIDIVR